MKRCIAFYNFGNKCVLELLVATYTLRNHYKGEIVWMLATNDVWNEQVATQVSNLGVNIIWTDFNIIRRNAKSAVKPYLFSRLHAAGYDSCIMCDGDLLFLKPLDSLWEPLEKQGILLTQFCNWRSNGPIMQGRLSNLKGLINNKQLDSLLNTSHPAVNIGVMGFTKEYGEYGLKIWDEITSKLAGKHIADEIAAHALLVCNEEYVHPYVAPSSFNASAKIGDMSTIESNHVVHYHGSAQGGGEADLRYENRRRSSRLWFAHLNKFYYSGLVPEARMWEQYATGGVFEVLQANPNLLFECSQEFQTC